MPRRPRCSTGGYVFHVLNRSVRRETLFHTERDYEAFERVLEEAQHRVPMRVLTYCLMPNHWHLVLWRRGDNDLSEFMRWLTVTHTQRYHKCHETTGSGPIYQGRFKSFPVQEDDHFLAVCRYVERNALRANLATRAELWRWSALWQRVANRYQVRLAAWPVSAGSEWLDHVNQPQTESELAAIRTWTKSGTPFGNLDWQTETARVWDCRRRRIRLGARERRE